MSCASITLAMICPTSSRLCFELWLTKAPCFGEQSRKVFDHQVSDDWWRGLDAHSPMRSGRRVDAHGSIPHVDQASCGRNAEERRGGKEGVSMWRFGWSTYHYKKK